MKKIKTLALSLILLSSFNTFSYANNIESAEKEEKLETNYAGLGLTAGFLSSVGISYRQFFADRWGYKITGVGYYLNKSLLATGGIQAMYVFNENRDVRFYGFAGASNFTSRNYGQTYYNADSDPNYIPPKSTSNYDITNNLGGGIGIEIGRKESGLMVFIEVPILFSFKKLTLDAVYPTGQAGIMYNF